MALRQALMLKFPGPPKSPLGRFVRLNDVWHRRPPTSTECRERLRTAASASSLNRLPTQPGFYLDLTDPRLQELMDGKRTFQWEGTLSCCNSKERCDDCKEFVGKVEAVFWDIAVLETAIWVPDEDIRRKWVAGRALCRRVAKLKGSLLQTLLQFVPDAQRQSLWKKVKLGRYQLLKDAWKGRPIDTKEGRLQLLDSAAKVPVGPCPAAPGTYVNFMHPKILALSTLEMVPELNDFDITINRSLVWIPDKLLYLIWALEKKRGLIGRLCEDVFRQLVVFLPRQRPKKAAPRVIAVVFQPVAPENDDDDDDFDDGGW